MYKHRLLISLLTFVMFSLQIEFVKANCTTYAGNFFWAETVQCEPTKQECCGMLKNTCCSKMEKKESEDFLNVICRIIVFVIVIGVILIFIAFLIGWIYSCYLIARQIQETPEEGDERTSVFSIPISDKPPSYNSLFKPCTNIVIQNDHVNQNHLSRSSHLSTHQLQRQLSFEQYNRPQYTLSTNSSNSNLNAAYVVDELPTYSSVIKNS